MPRRLLAIDWGSSALRGALLDAEGGVLEERSAARGLLTIEPGGFPAVFVAHFGDWLRAPDVRCLMAGMVGSRQGWVEAPYCACPAGLDQLAAHLAGVPDVMRGEEIKVFGALELLGLESAEILMPGTHSKWASVARGRIQRFATAMSGELYALLRRRSILARTLPDADDGFDADAFDRGLDRSFGGQGLLQTAFSVRTLALFERLPPSAGPSYLSGLVIGEELRARPLAGVEEVVVIGAEPLAERFERALRRLGRRVVRLGEEAAWRGLHAVQQRRDA